MINNNSRSISTVLFLLFCLTSLGIMGCAASAKVEQNNTGSFDLGPAIETDGLRRLALIVGVGDYKSSNVRDLAGPPNDARRFYNLLTGPNGYFQGYNGLPGTPVPDQYGGPVICKWMIEAGYQDLRPTVNPGEY